MIDWDEERSPKDERTSDRQRYEKRDSRERDRDRYRRDERPREGSRDRRDDSRDREAVGGASVDRVDDRDGGREREGDRGRYRRGGASRREIKWDQEDSEVAEKGSRREHEDVGDDERQERQDTRAQRFGGSSRSYRDRENDSRGNSRERNGERSGDRDRGASRITSRITYTRDRKEDEKDSRSERYGDRRGDRDLGDRREWNGGDERRGRYDRDMPQDDDTAQRRSGGGGGGENDGVRNERSEGGGVRGEAGPSSGANTEAPARQRKPVELGRGGGVYIPPFRLKQMMAEASQDKTSEQYQKMMWEALRKTLNGIINKVQLYVPPLSLLDS